MKFSHEALVCVCLSLNLATVVSACDVVFSILSDTNNVVGTEALIATTGVVSDDGSGMQLSKCVYYYLPDFTVFEAGIGYDGFPTYAGTDRPNIDSGESCNITFDDTIAADSPFRTAGFVTVSDYDNILFGGLPLYFYDGDIGGVRPELDGHKCVGVLPSTWASLGVDAWGQTLPDYVTPEPDYQNMIVFADGDVTFEYTLLNDTLQAKTTIVNQECGWIGTGFGPGGMVGSSAVIGQNSANGTVEEYLLTTKSAAGVSPSLVNSVTNGVFTPGVNSTLRFEIPVDFWEGGLLPDEDNFLIWAWGTSDFVSYHDKRAVETVFLNQTIVVVDNTTDVNDTDSTVTEDTVMYANNYTFTSAPIILEYNFTADSFIARATLPGQVGWFGIGFGEEMVGSSAVIGQMSTDAEVQEFLLDGKNSAGVQPIAVSGVTNGSFSTDLDATVMEFTIPLQFGRANITANATNAMIWALGTSEFVSYHQARGQESVMLMSSE
ncbi:hypothetical protein SARC_09011 [Sphaeroforma arctica JP610]|uniref:DOMON domain-containing protein n=1 Tax=Sphaeroforma arctica JP610 TaxID=667725 RepID=A0A0L0FPD7_9EUKA|nr:hypothetical protein SARC_09011 [Sphaeroforma arctica JP610]KNC78564.1 hypothetical protein SARC_09011 [Sphaeroforma arctica JP610]|eukprot:XP_014152466.1 hypothetical protein SARC_09011 [Sphaeroforma arctica JP610]